MQPTDFSLLEQVPNDIHLQGGLGLPAQEHEPALATEEAIDASQAEEHGVRLQDAVASSAESKYSVMVLTGA